MRGFTRCRAESRKGYTAGLTLELTNAIESQREAYTRDRVALEREIANLRLNLDRMSDAMRSKDRDLLERERITDGQKARIIELESHIDMLQSRISDEEEQGVKLRQRILQMEKSVRSAENCEDDGDPSVLTPCSDIGDAAQGRNV